MEDMWPEKPLSCQFRRRYFIFWGSFKILLYEMLGKQNIP